MKTRYPRTGLLFWWAAALLLFSASSCGEERHGGVQRDANGPQRTTPALDAGEIAEPDEDAASVAYKVISVSDGDTIVVSNSGEETTVRLQGIDCPEFGQPFGEQAKRATSGLCLGKLVRLQVTGEDRYGRTLAHVVLPDGTELNRELVRQGYAWWYRRYSDDSLERLEATARQKKLGLWTDADAMPPWEWRTMKRTGSGGAPADDQIMPNGVAIVALLPNPKGADEGHEQVRIANSTRKPVDLMGWKLVDEAGNIFLLSGKIEPGKSLVVTMDAATMSLNNDGDTVVLIDSERISRSRVTYSCSQARSGAVVRFER